MRKMLDRLFVICTLTTSATAGCHAESSPAETAPQEVAVVARPHFMPMHDRGSLGATGTTAAAASLPSGTHLAYQGGKVIQRVNVVKVLFGTGTYIPELTSTSGVNVASAYTQMVTSGVFDWLDEYNTISPSQSIDRGSFGGSFQIRPVGRNGTTITDSDIQNELLGQIGTGNLPLPDDNTIYMVHFPAGKSIKGSEGSQSCVSGGFCAYHSTFKFGTRNVYYGVLPDLTGDCAVGCGTAPTTFQNQTSVASHELIEAVTDPEVGLATQLSGPPVSWTGAPLGWVNTPPNNRPTPSQWAGFEIGDICTQIQDTFTGTDGATYTIQKEFSNAFGGCITERDVFPPLPNLAGSSGIVWRCGATPCGQAPAESVAIWHDANSGATTFPGAPDATWQIQGTGDFDGNGLSDILWRKTDGTVAIWKDGNQIDTWPGVLDNNWQIQGVGDFDGNGNADILWRCVPQVPATSCGNAVAGSVAIWQFANGNYGWTTWAGAVDFSWQIRGVGDFDGNGKSDILWRNSNGSNSIWYNGNSNTSVWPPALDGNWQVAGVGDFDGNGNSDILWRCVPQPGVTSCGQAVAGAVASWFFSGGFYGWTGFPGALDFNWQIEGVGDFDRNHNSDILWRCIPRSPATSCGHAVAGATAVWPFSGGNVGRTALPGALDFNWQIQGVGKFD